jgi:transposase InsO family protein
MVPREVWLALNREGTQVARCTMARLMRELDLRGARSGKQIRTTVADSAAAVPRTWCGGGAGTGEWARAGGLAAYEQRPAACAAQLFKTSIRARYAAVLPDPPRYCTVGSGGGRGG